MKHFSLILGITLCLFSIGLHAQSPAPFMMLTHVGNQELEGQPLTWTQDEMLLLGRDGQLYTFPPKYAEKSKKTGTVFRGYSIMEMRNRLREEFDSSFDVSHSQHFVVAHPKGVWSVWAERMESFYRSFTHYMAVRGFDLSDPQVPLVAIVFRNKTDYYNHAAKGGTPLQPGTLGHYDPSSNRIFLFDAGLESDQDWTASIDTIIHEATHQTASNVGIHRRFADQPRWLVEGLAMMFEAKALWDPRATHTQRDRINYGRLDDFRYFLANRPADMLPKLISSDSLFRTSAVAAYAEAWALSFYLCETRPKQYCEYLERVGARKAFSKYPARQRMADFARYFGSDFTQLDADLNRFVAELK
ncbi:DUF1570 domain-containing protein [Bythopirellula polymerisocia]|uniref:DUF1570 domain-containing protein n=1 Tax=Bythopirellula polymerisocia TaxID=2528003 RepID=A0A5C6D3B5_9BACT|nr:DUF1570 domain-containing protein [Bythopirellula polymerisocia]TWU29716.1 hypothetical protein Pla144_04950 [Bythopirellula polymerisocia]